MPICLISVETPSVGEFFFGDEGASDLLGRGAV
jgi:hypothetical protein